jgi:hypothetical protein
MTAPTCRHDRNAVRRGRVHRVPAAGASQRPTPRPRAMVPARALLPGVFKQAVHTLAH